MKHFVLSVILVLLTFEQVSGQSEQFRILYINTPSINISDRTLVKGDVFCSSDLIKWSSKDQAMRVVSLENGKQYIFSARDIKSRKGSLLSYITSKRKLSTRPGKITTILGLSSSISDTLLILDRCEFHTTIPIDADRFFYATYSHNGELINKILPSIDGGFAIDRSLWTIDNKTIKPQTTTITIYYYDEPNETVTKVAGDIVVIPLDCEIK